MIKNLSNSGVSIITIGENAMQKHTPYYNSPSGRAAIVAEQLPKTVAEVMTVWGDKPTVPDTVPAPILPPTTDQQIAALKSQIADSDYKIIKCSECKLAGQPMPYDIAALHAERQVLRDKINVLEAEQANIKKER